MSFWSKISDNIANGPANFFRGIGKYSIDLFDDVTGRTKEREEAEAKKEAAAYHRDTILGQMERELAANKQNAQNATNEMLLEANQTQGRIEQAYGGNQEKAYLEAIAAEEQFQNVKVNTERNAGALTASRGASGLRNTGSISDLMTTEATNAAVSENRARTSLDRGMVSMVSGNMINRQAGSDQIEAVRTKASQTMEQFNSGSAYMNLYNYNRERVTGETEIQLNYLNDAIDDTYNWKGYLGDALRIGGAAAAGYATGGASGALFGGTSAMFA